MEAFLDYLIRGIVDEQNSVEIKKNETDYSIEFTIKVSADEYGRIIGRGGKTINSLKTLLNLYAYKKNDGDKKRILLKIEDSGGEKNSDTIEKMD